MTAPAGELGSFEAPGTNLVDLLEVEPGQHQSRAVAATGLEDHPDVLVVTGSIDRRGEVEHRCVRQRIAALGIVDRGVDVRRQGRESHLVEHVEHLSNRQRPVALHALGKGLAPTPRARP